MVIVIDNYDSFVYNLARYVHRWGYPVRVFRHDAITAKAVLKLNPSHVVLSPGPGRPEDAGHQMDIIHQCHQQVPILGVCLGHQGIAQYFGARIHQVPPCHGKASLITHQGTSIFQGLPEAFEVGRYHSLAIDSTTLPPSLQVLATVAHQPDLVMAVTHQRYPCLGLQFHPESVLTPQGFQLMGAFLKQTRP